MGNALKQRLTKIQVDEISFVDYPANEAQFVVVKSKEEGSMTKQQVGEQPVEKTDSGNAEAGSASAPTNEAITKALKELQTALQLASTDASETPAASDEQPPVADEVEASSSEAAPVTETEEVQKEVSTNGQAETQQETSTDDQAEVTKGVLAAGRVKQLKRAIDELAALLKDLNPEVGETAEAVPVEKSVEVQQSVEKALAPLVERVNAVVTRLESLEKTAGVSRAVNGDGTDTGAVQKSFWAGIL